MNAPWTLLLLALAGGSASCRQAPARPAIPPDPVLVLDRLVLSDEALIEREEPPARVRLRDRAFLNDILNSLAAEKGGPNRAGHPDYRITFYNEGREIDRVWLDTSRLRWGFRDHPAVLGRARKELALLLDRLLVPDDVLPKEED